MLGLFNILCHLIMMFLCFFGPDDLYTRESGVFKFPIISGLMLICVLEAHINFNEIRCA